jgi:hypothetical protein
MFVLKNLNSRNGKLKAGKDAAISMKTENDERDKLSE